MVRGRRWWSTSWMSSTPLLGMDGSRRTTSPWWRYRGLRPGGELQSGAHLLAGASVKIGPRRIHGAFPAGISVRRFTCEVATDRLREVGALSTLNKSVA